MKFKKIIQKTASWTASVLPSPVKRSLYKIPFVANLIRRSLNAAVPDGYSEVVIAAGVAKGMKMILDLHAEKDYWLGNYEPDLQKAARNLIHSGNVIYDVGANIGYISLISAKLAGESGKIFSFEALPKNIKRLNENIAVNGLGSLILPTHAAVINANKPVTFLTHSSTSMGKAVGSAGRDENYSGRITVPGIVLDHFVYQAGNPAPDLIKIDIEGGEGQALAGMPRILSEAQPVFLIELHGEEAARQVWKILEANSYHVHRMIPGYPPVRQVDELNWKAYIIAVAENKRHLLT